jgi:hypothetical protein
MRNTFQTPQNMWNDYLGQMTFILLAVCLAYYWHIWGLVIVALILSGMFHRQVLTLVTESMGHVNELFIGRPTNGGTNRHIGGFIATLRGIASHLWSWAKKPFQPGNANSVNITQESGGKTTFLLNIADIIEGRPESFWYRRSQALRRIAERSSEKSRIKQEKRCQKELTRLTKPKLYWTNIIGGIIVSALLIVYIAGDIFITLKTLLGMMDVELPESITNNSLFSSFEILTAAILVSNGILFGIYIFEILGFIPILPLHTLSSKTQKTLLVIAIICTILTLVVVGALAMSRVNSMISEPVSSDINVSNSDLDLESDSTIGHLPDEESLNFTDTDKLLINISLVGVSALAFVGTMFAFNGPIVLIKFLALGFVALIGCLIWLISNIGRLTHGVIMLALSLIYFFVALIVTRISARVLARPIVSFFHIRGTDDPDDEGMLVRQPVQNENHNQQPPSEPQVQTHQETTTAQANEQQTEHQEQSRPNDNTGTQDNQQTRQPENQASFAPKASEWNPLD